MTAAVFDESKPDTRTRILQEAERLFRHYGYSKTTVADIARELGMSPANVYRFFPSKLAINEAICSQFLDERDAASLKIANGPGSALERIRSILLTIHTMTVSVLLDEKKVHEMVAVAMDEQWESIRVHIHRQIEIIARVVAEGMAAGEIAKGDASHVAKCLNQSFMSQIHPQMVVKCMSDPDTASAEDMLDFILRALKS